VCVLFLFFSLMSSFCNYLHQKLGNIGMLDNFYFDNSFGFVLQFKNGSHVLVHKKVKIRTDRT